MSVPPHRVEVLSELLGQLWDLSEPGTGRAGVAGSGDRLPLMPHEPRCGLLTDMRRCTCVQRCVRELERLLYELQFADYALWQAIRLRYLQCEHVYRDVVYRRGRFHPIGENEQVVGVPGAWTLTLADQRSKHQDKPLDARVKVCRWNPAVDAKHVQAGVLWLAEHWSASFEPYLPVLDTKAA